MIQIGKEDLIKDLDGEILQDDGTEWATGNQREIPKKLKAVGTVWIAEE